MSAPTAWSVYSTGSHSTTANGATVDAKIGEGLNRYEDGPERIVCEVSAPCYHPDPAARARLQTQFMRDLRLITAAPELLEALQYLLSAHGEQIHDACEMGHRAIAKATGAAP